MTAATMQPDNGFPARFALGVMLLAVLAGALGAILTTRHAEKHAEAAQIRRCWQNDDPAQVWQPNNDDSVRIFCYELPECGKVGILIAQVWPSLVQGCEWRERSSFVPRDGSPGRVEKYLSQFAERIK